MGILIVGLGPGPKGYITGQTVLALEKAEACYCLLYTSLAGHGVKTSRRRGCGLRP